MHDDAVHTNKYTVRDKHDDPFPHEPEPTGVTVHVLDEVISMPVLTKRLRDHDY